MQNNAWQYVRGENYCSKVTDGTHDTPEQVERGKYLITSKHIKGDEIDFDSAYFITEEDFNEINKRSKVDQWDVIISMIGAYCGFCFIESNSDIDYAIKNVGLFKTGNEINAKWLYYYLNSSVGKAHLDAAKSGSTQPYIALGALRELPILTPKDEITKKKIVNVLDSIDKKIRNNNRINAELEAMAKTLYDYWFVQFDFPDATGKPYKSSGGKMVYNTTLKREIPVGWNDGTLDDLGQIVGGSTPSTKKESNFTASGTPWITPNDLSDNQGYKFITRGAQDVSDSGIKDASLKKYPAGTVLLSSRAPIGYMAIAREELTTNQGFKSFIPTNDYSSAFIYYTLKNSLKTIVQHASGSTFKEVSGAVLKTVKICLPASGVVEQFTNAVAPTFKRQDLLEQENQHLTQLRDWLLPMLMNGQVTVA
ncbi:restriction endonuclease subunit S [Trichlorobacter lovleyi]|uniref:Restriction modification system DNA specificity domain n=1 Tax=Trichlorobacter lovleyi (strain ATCC BAA-1151 / DSM 17278 / SZ) TaxID=398767 RepID=B3E3U9_TRIL1|nr:restriction endonuclease subunit S [Trichlorobacter lovleyi]ACD94363.1 restriction modification system DNA specificity domain [Trichlorobacter lovleyi SZ]